VPARHCCADPDHDLQTQYVQLCTSGPCAQGPCGSGPGPRLGGTCLHAVRTARQMWKRPENGLIPCGTVKGGRLQGVVAFWLGALRIGF
jgi:hypothetical protein